MKDIRHHPAVLRALATATLLATLIGCSGLPGARMALNGALADLPAERVERFIGLHPGPRGEVQLDGWSVRFERHADRLALFDRLAWDKTSLKMTLAAPDGTRSLARCDGRRAEASAGILQPTLRPLGVECRFEGAASARLELRERGSNTALTAHREGTLQWGAVRLELRSEHRLEGSPLPLTQPAGYLMAHQGRTVAAVELTSGQPLLRRQPGLAPEVQHSVTLAALALGLLSDPAALAQ
jgi:hypothetical protein